MGQLIPFNYSLWTERYPQFAGNPTEPLASLYWSEAGLYVANSPYSRVTDPGALQSLLMMVTAHIAALGMVGPDGQLANPLVGRIANATEGSVSISTELADLGKSAAFWTQTPYGFAFWQATAAYRTAVYRAVPPYRWAPYGYGPYTGGLGGWRG